MPVWCVILSVVHHGLGIGQFWQPCLLFDHITLPQSEDNVVSERIAHLGMNHTLQKFLRIYVEVSRLSLMSAIILYNN